MQRGDQLEQARRQDHEIARRAMCFIIGMRNACRDKDGCALRRLNLGLRQAERQRSCEDVPRLVVGVVYMEIIGTAARPFVYDKRISRSAYPAVGSACGDDGFGHGIGLHFRTPEYCMTVIDDWLPAASEMRRARH